MSHNPLLTKIKMTEENSNGHFNPRYKAQSTSQLLSPDSVIVKSVSSTSSPTSSTSSLATSNSPKTSLSSFLKISLSNRKTTTTPPPPPSEDHFVMTIIKSPSTNPQRATPNDPIPQSPITTNEDVSNNSKLFKSKVTAAFNHMKYRKFL